MDEVARLPVTDQTDLFAAAAKRLGQTRRPGGRAPAALGRLVRLAALVRSDVEHHQ
jgi:predicted ATPase